MVEPSEVVNLLLAFGALPVLIGAAKRQGLDSSRKSFLWGYGFMLVGYAATVAEGLAFHDAFNLVEHLAYASSGIAFFAAVARLTADAPWDSGVSS